MVADRIGERWGDCVNAIAIINTNRYWCGNARMSVCDAADRWDCKVVEFTDIPVANVFREKFRIHRRLADFDRVLYLDADMMIRDDCPNLFEIVPPNMFGAVCNYQTDECLDERLEMDGKAWGRLCEWLGRKDFSAAGMVNGGFLLWTPAIHNLIIDQLDALLPERLPLLCEQAAWSWAFRDCLFMLPPAFNRVGRTVWESKSMGDYVYHWANWFEYRGAENKRDRMTRMEWQTGVTACR